MKNLFVCSVVLCAMFACNSPKAKEEVAPVATPEQPAMTIDATAPAPAAEEMKPEADPMTEMSLDATPIAPAPVVEMK